MDGDTHFLFEEVLPVLKRTQLDLPFLVLQLCVWKLEIGDEVIEGLEHLLHREGAMRLVLQTQTVKVSVTWRQTKGDNRGLHI